MLKKFFMAAIVGLIICAGVKVEAERVYVGKSDVTDCVCYILTDTITYKKEGNMVISTATIEMYKGPGNGAMRTYCDYTFYYYPGYADEPRFENSQGYRGTAHPYHTPVEWAMYEVIRKRY
jgi:hypothetical protein